jgi:hypothetical protein
MPLTQDRMLAIIRECEAIDEELEMLRKDMQVIVMEPVTDDMKLTLIRAKAYAPRRTHKIATIIERANYQRTWKRNEKLRVRATGDRQLVKRMIENPAAYREPPDAADRLMDQFKPLDIPESDGGFGQHAPTPSANETPAVNPPKPAFWQSPGEKAQTAQEQMLAAAKEAEGVLERQQKMLDMVAGEFRKPPKATVV